MMHSHLPSLFLALPYFRSSNQNCWLFSDDVWSPTSSEEVINISRSETLCRIFNHRFGSWRGCFSLCLKIGQKLKNLLLLLLHSNKSSKELFMDFLLMMLLRIMGALNELDFSMDNHFLQDSSIQLKFRLNLHEFGI